MAEVYKILGQAAPTAGVATNLVAVPAGAGTNMVISTLQICNTGATATTVRVTAAIAAAAVTNAQYLLYDVAIPGNSSISYTIGITLDQTDVLRVSSVSGSVSFNAFGTLVTP